MYNLAHVFYEYNLAFILIFAVLELWLIQHLVFSLNNQLGLVTQNLSALLLRGSRSQYARNFLQCTVELLSQDIFHVLFRYIQLLYAWFKAF